MTHEEAKKMGATHYRQKLSGVSYFKKGDNCIEMWCWDRWIYTGHTDISIFKPL